MAPMTQEQKVEFLAALVKQSQDLLKQAMEFADQHSLSFQWDDEQGARKQWYVGKGSLVPSEWGEWKSSSDNC